jgi:hypothetical protein
MWRTDTFLRRRQAASALAINAVCRRLVDFVSIFWVPLWQMTDFLSCSSYVGAGFPLFAGQMYRKLGTPGAGSLVAGLATVGVLVPVLLIRYGPRLRALSQCEYHPGPTLCCYLLTKQLCHAVAAH